MNKTEKIIKEYSSKKLKEIIEQQSSSYSKSFIDYSKDELIRRGENFPFNEELEKEITVMNSTDLKNLVEKKWNNFHLEYLEVARKEYLKRNFKNETSDNELYEKQKEKVVTKYPALSTIAGFYLVLAWIIGLVAIIIALYPLFKGEDINLMILLPSLVGGAIIVLSLLAVSESIKVLIDIEVNTRNSSE